MTGQWLNGNSGDARRDKSSGLEEIMDLAGCAWFSLVVTAFEAATQADPSSSAAVAAVRCNDLSGILPRKNAISAL